jgi:hypothetical protein
MYWLCMCPEIVTSLNCLDLKKKLQLFFLISYFALRRGECPRVFLDNIAIPQEQKVKYLEMILDKRLTWKSLITKKDDIEHSFENALQNITSAISCTTESKTSYL